MNLGNDCWGDVSRSLAGERKVDSIFTTFLNDFLKEFKPVVLPDLVLPRRLLREDVVRFVNNKVKSSGWRAL